MQRLVLTLFINGNKPLISEAAKFAAEELCRSMPAPCTLNIIDVQHDPAAVKAHDIITTPTLLREKPGPPVKVTGNLLDRHRVLSVLLGMGHQNADHPPPQ